MPGSCWGDCRVKPWISWTLNGLGLGLVAMLTANAGWLAQAPRGYAKLIAAGGTKQQFDHRPASKTNCPAARIEPPLHDYLENTVSGLQQADRLGANMVQLDLAATADGRLVAFGDPVLDCRTGQPGAVGKTALAALQQLDPGAGYTADGGKTYPLKGLPTSRIPVLEEVLAALPETPILFTLKGSNPADGALLARALKTAGRRSEQLGDGFSADDPVLAPLRAAFPKAWAFSPASAAECASRYRLIGWFTLVPDACKGGALFVPLDRKWTFPGWPDRLLNRMAKANVRVILVAPQAGGNGPPGLDLPEQIAEIPPSYTGYILAEDIWTMGPALQPAASRRTSEANAALDQALERRRKLRE